MESFDKQYFNKQIERVVIGCILLKGELYEKIIGRITIDDFVQIIYKTIFKIFEILYKKGIKIDIITVSDYGYKNHILEAGLGSLTEIQNSVPTIEAIEQYLKLLKNYTYNRTILRTTEDFRLGKIEAGELENIINKIKPPDEV